METNDPGRVSKEEREKAAQKELSYLLFQLALARRRLEDIMGSGDLSSILNYRELTFVHTVVSDVHSLLRRVRYGDDQA